MIKFKLTLVFLFILVLPIVTAGYFDCEQIIQCDQQNVYYSSGSMACINEISTVFPEQIVLNIVLEKYYCSGTELFTWDFTMYANEYLDTGYIYYNKTLFQTISQIRCESSSQFWYNIRGVINDLHTLRENPITTDYSTIESGDCPDVSRSVNNYPEQEDIPGNYHVLFPIHGDVEKIYEPAFEPVSTLNYITYFTNDYPTTRSVQQATIDETCYEDNRDPVMCHYLSSDYRQRNFLNDFYAPYINIVDLDGSDTLGSDYTLGTNMRETLKYHFFYGKKVPIYARMSIEWNYEFKNNPESFRGYHYTFLILGMYQAGGNWFYWIQYPEGDKYIWSETTLLDRWGYDDYDGYYGYYDSHPNNSPDFKIINSESGKEAYKEDGKYILLKNEEYKVKIDDNSSAWEHETDDPWVQLDIYDDDNYETTIKDVSSQGNYIQYFIDFGIETTDLEIGVLYYGKSGWEKVVKTVEVRDDTPEMIFSPDEITELTEEVNVSLNVDYPINVSISHDFSDDSVILQEYFSFQKSMTYSLNLVGIDTSYSSDYNDFFRTEMRYCFVNTSVCRNRFIIKDIDNDNYKTSNFAYYFGKKANFTPIIPDYCVVNKTCYMQDDNTISEFGNYYEFLGLGSVTDDYLALLNPIYTYYIDSVYQGQFFAGDYGTFKEYSNTAVKFEVEKGILFDSIGNYTVELCQGLYDHEGDDQIFFDCYEDEVEVSKALGGGGLDGDTDETENASHKCSWNLTFDNTTLGIYQESSLQHYWIDIDKDGVVDSSLTSCGGVYTKSPDCVDDFCITGLDRDDFSFDSYCQGDSTIYDETDFEKKADLYICYDNSEMPCGDVGLDTCMEPTGYEGSFNILNLVYIDECIDESFVEPVNYSIMPSETYLDNTDDFLEGLWCEKVEEVSMKCQFDCQYHDFDGDGVNDCLDVCCNGDDTIDTDSDGIPDNCDLCPDDPGEDDVDNDGICPSEDNCPNIYNPDQYDTDGDGYGNACDICEGGDDDIDADGDGIPDYCDEEDSESGPGGDEGDYEGENSTVNKCNNGVKDQDENYIDYGGICGNCTDDELSSAIGEIDIDYGGKCGQCDYTLSKKSKDTYYQMIEFQYPFQQEWCEQNRNILLGGAAGFLVVLILMFLFFLLLFIILYFCVIRFIIGRFIKEGNKNRRKIEKNKYKEKY